MENVRQFGEYGCFGVRSFGSMLATVPSSSDKKPRPPSAPRLYVILARKSPLAVVFRRGPSKQVQLLSWDTERHEVRAGQWFKGRIYERRCDLSPSGEKLIYFAASQKPPFGSWTAVSRPPYFTALALWPKGDCWGGGGLFKTERIIQLNHGSYQSQLADGFKLPKSISIEPPVGWAGRGEDAPILPTRMHRDGWVLSQQSEAQRNKSGAELWVQYPQNEVWSKTRGRWRIDMRLLGIKERDGAWYVMEHDIVDAEGNLVQALGRSDWADWSHSGEILLARRGRLLRISVHERSGPGAAEELIDLTSQVFKPVAPPPTALRWGGHMREGELLECG